MTISIYSRYYRSQVIEVDGRVSLAQRYVLSAPAYPDSILHVVVGDETIDLLARRYYGREDLWYRIADANPGRFPMDWQAGDTIVIPPIRVATRTPRS
jgi:hypothetical protein